MDSRSAKATLIRCAALAPVGLIAVCLTGSAQSSGRPDVAFSVRGRITMLAADGSRAAVTTHVKPGCGRIVVWTAPGKRSTRVKPGILGCGGDGVTHLAIAPRTVPSLAPAGA